MRLLAWLDTTRRVERWVLLFCMLVLLSFMLRSVHELLQWAAFTLAALRGVLGLVEWLRDR